jgi:hypothetical protein
MVRTAPWVSRVPGIFEGDLMFRVPRKIFLLLFLLSAPTAALCGELPKDVLEKIDASIVAAYKTASAKQPCKIGTGGKLHLLHWQDVDKCLSQAVSLVNWDALSRQLEEIRPKNVSEGDFAAAVENSLTKNALPYDRVFKVKDEKALLPLTNPVLKYLPPNSLQNQTVFGQSGAQIGTFAGVYFSEHAGGSISGSTYRLALFQYLDPQGRIQVPTEKQLRDYLGNPLFGVLWSKVMLQPGFRLTSEKLTGIAARR